MKYRVEDKYLIYEDQIAFLKTRLNEIMVPDSNMKDGGYLIRSLYFDDMFNSCMLENEGGISKREKYRIRTYNNDASLIKLELKGKNSGFTTKDSATITKETVDVILNNGTGPGSITGCGLEISKESPPLLKRLYAETKTRLLAPVTIVEYERYAYVEPLGNVRITFDRNIGCTTQIQEFWDSNISSIPILPVGQHILEVKYDEFIPDYISKTINNLNLSRSSFSKYYYSRTNPMIGY